MHKSEFRTLDGQTLSVSIRAEFLESTRQHAISEGGPTAYVAPISHVIGEPTETNERCVVIALPGSASKGIDYSATSVTPHVRRRADGTPVACALLANRQVAVHAEAVNESRPLNSGRLNVLWMLEDNCTFVHYPYDEQAEEWFSAAGMVADGHRHEEDDGVDSDFVGVDEPTVIEVLNFWLVETAG